MEFISANTAAQDKKHSRKNGICNSSRRYKYLSVSFLFLLLTCLPLSGAENIDSPVRGTTENPYLVPETEDSIKIDGILDEEAWEKAMVFEMKYEIQPGDNSPPVARTEVLLTYDSHNLYAAFRCYDENPSEIRARLTDRENFMGGDDHVNFHIDTFNDERRYFAIGANPRGVQMDAVVNNESFDWNWDAIFDSAGKIEEWGYAIELGIPFSQLRFQRSGSGQVWGFNAWRIHPRSVGRFMSIAPQDRNNNCTPCQMIKIKGFEGVSPGKNIELVPTVTAVRTDARDSLPDGAFAKSNQEVDAGITGQWGMTPNLTLSATLNPDFSQVEADSRQLDINEPFALYYREKRPFFQEGADFFKSPRIDAVYTRTIRDPLWGGKISGKEGSNTVAGFVVEDRVTNVVLPSSQNSRNVTLPGSSYSSLFRYKKDLGNRYTLGTLVTSREGDDYFNRVYGADGDLRLTDKDRVSMQVLGSSTRYPGDFSREYDQPLGEFSGHALDVYYSHDSRSFYWSTGVGDYGRNFRADMGYVPQVDYREYYGAFGHKWVPEENSWYSDLRLEGSFRYDEDQSGRLLQRRVDIWGRYQGPLQSYAVSRLFKSREAYNGKEFDIFYYGSYTEITPSRNISIGLDTSFGNKIDYANTRLGDRVRLSPNLDLKLGDQLSINLMHEYERLDVPGGRLYTANISQGTVSYQFNIRTFIRTILQYVDYKYNPSLYTFDIEPEFRQLYTQFLFSYKINPRTVLFLGYSDNHYANQDYSMIQADRTFFAKIGYSWQY
jgi:Domain of unknown function (DUF5916)/Carbohydrate family 9 binding domain-like